MTQELGPPATSAPTARNDSEQDRTPDHGTVEPCEFEELLERAMEILKTRRAGVGS